MKESIFITSRQLLLKQIGAFIPQGAPIVLGFSGGPDSLFLFHILRELPYRLHAVHVDHGWREESQEQAGMLQKYCVQYNVPFHGVRLPKFPGIGNLEEWSRDQRFAVFFSQAQALGSHWIFLGHQANDQAEVVMKRVLEGSSLIRLHAMKKQDRRDDFWLFRPLLGVRKEDIIRWLDQHGHIYIQDPSNQDSRFLRARMRNSIFPLLQQAVGKNFLSGLNKIAHEAELLEQFMETIRLGSTKSLCANGWGYCEYAASGFAHLFLARYLVGYLQKQLQFGSVPASVIEAIVQVFCGESGSKQFPLHQGCIVVEPHFFALFLQQPSAIQTYHCVGDNGSYVDDGKEVVWSGCSPTILPMITWEQYLQGEPLSVIIPRGSFTVMRSNERLVRSLPKARRYTSLRPYIPVIVQNERIIVDMIHAYNKVPLGECTRVTIRKV